MANGDPVRVGQIMSGQAFTRLVGDPGPHFGDCILSVGEVETKMDGPLDGLRAYGAGAKTFSPGGAGVVGEGGNIGAGVVGRGGFSSGAGVLGCGSFNVAGDGGSGFFPAGPGVAGHTNAPAGAGGFGSPAVCGIADFTDGVVGIATLPATYGVRGFNGTKDAWGVGVLGHTPQSSQGYGVIGDGNPSGVGVLGQGAVGIFGMGPLAGVFKGDVSITGDLNCQGLITSAVPLASGALHRSYGVESPESWFEDFGEATLTHGKARVKIAADFKRCLGRGPLHVFLTPLGDCKGLYVRRRSVNGFDVRELGGGTSSLKFSYRVVAKRRGKQAKRLEKVRLPHLSSGLSSKALAGITAQDTQLRSLVESLAARYLKRAGRGSIGGSRGKQASRKGAARAKKG